MPIENNFLHFENDKTFQNQKSEIKEDSITFIKDSGKIYTHEREYKSVNWSTLKKPEANVGDVCFYDKEQDKLIIVSEWSVETHPASRYTPVGVVVIPSSHDVYGTGEAGVISLRAMHCNTPSTGGTSEQSMGWGEFGTDISELPDLDQAPIVGTGSSVGDVSSTVTGQYNYPYLPSNKFSTVQCPHDTDTYYYSSSSSYNQAPSPYLTDGSRNPGYYQTTSPSSANNCLADFDGIGNTEKIITQRGTKDYNSWAPTYNSQTDYPAASCCDMFHTEGTQQGDWYLPAMGELGYIMPPFNKINEVIRNMRTAYGSSVGVELSTGYNYWSSTEYSSDRARVVSTLNGNVDLYFKYNNYYVRAFLRVKP